MTRRTASLLSWCDWQRATISLTVTSHLIATTSVPLIWNLASLKSAIPLNQDSKTALAAFI